MPRKLPDTVPHTLSGGRSLYPHEHLFLTPKAPLTEEHNGNILDVNRYFAIGVVDPQDHRSAFGHRSMNIFSRYGLQAFGLPERGLRSPRPRGGSQRD